VVADTVDVADRERLAGWLTAFDDAHPVDLLIANAGISIDKDNSSLDDFAVIRKTLDVNVGGVLNTVEPLMARLMERRKGQIAVVSSLASFIGLPYSASYNASKAAVRVWGESIRYVMKKYDVGVSVICPGFVVSRMTAQAPFPMPFLMTSAQASKIIRRGLAANRARIAFPIGTKAAVWFGSVLPGRWTARLLGA
jgi:short-subunit dehydrogenase